jgi:hypothetical protein
MRCSYVAFNNGNQKLFTCPLVKKYAFIRRLYVLFVDLYISDNEINDVMNIETICLNVELYNKMTISL